MIKKKVIRMVISSIFLFGSYAVSQLSATGLSATGTSIDEARLQLTDLKAKIGKLENRDEGITLEELQEQQNNVLKLWKAPIQGIQWEDLQGQLQCMQKISKIKPGGATLEDLEERLQCMQKISKIKPGGATLEDLQKQLQCMQKISKIKPGGATWEDLQIQVALRGQMSIVKKREKTLKREDTEQELMLIEEALSKFPATEEWKEIELEEQGLIKQQKTLLLKRQSMLMKMQQPMGARSQEREKEESVKVLESWGDLKAALDQFKAQTIAAEQLRAQIELTRNYYLFNVQVPRLVPDDEWRAAKIVEMFHRIAQYLPETRIASWCLLEIHKYTGNEEPLKPFKYMKLLLLSQSVRWDDGEKYALSAQKNSLLIKETIRRLCNIAIDPEEDEGVRGEVKTFLRAIGKHQDYKNSFPPDYNIDRR
jgi:hypothetical protein